MKYHLTAIVIAFLFVVTSYQSVQAAANKFTAKQVQAGDNLISILRKNGFKQKEREIVLSSNAKLRRLFLTLDTRYLIKKNNNDTELRIFDSQTSDAFLISKNKGKIVARAYQPNYKIIHAKIQGKVYGSLLGSILAKIKSNWVATRFIDAYAFDIAPRSVGRGAAFALTVEKQYEEGQFIKYGEVLYTSLGINGRLVKKKFVRDKNGGVFFSADDLSEEKPFYAPVDYIKIASRFKPNRLHPITKRRQPHLGLDFELPVGETIYAPRKGTVVRYGKNHAAGNYIVLRHSNGMETYYNHLKKIDGHIRKGLLIKAGEKLGEVGCTGYCTRAHLHFAVKKKGRMVDPLKYIKSYPVHMESMLAARVASN